MKIYYLALFIAFICTQTVKSQTNEELFARANAHYANDEHEQAAELYRQILDNGFSSAELLYNLGNVYFRMDKIPSAILYYERALRMSPNDRDIEFNLKIANLRIVDKFEPVPKLFFVEWYEFIQGYLNSSTWAWVILIFFWLAFIFLVLFIISQTPAVKKLLFLFVVVSFLGALVSFLITNHTYYKEKNVELGIIFATSIYVKSAPDDNSVDLFILHEGTKVEITDRLETWAEILLANGNKGWVPAGILEII